MSGDRREWWHKGFFHDSKRLPLEMSTLINISGTAKFFSKNRACISFPSPRHSTDSIAEKAREQRCLPIALEVAAATLSGDGNALGQSPEPRCKPSQSALPALLQLFCAAGIAATARTQPQGWAASLGTAALGVISSNNSAAVTGMCLWSWSCQWVTCRGLLEPWQHISSPFSDPGLRC